MPRKTKTPALTAGDVDRLVEEAQQHADNRAQATREAVIDEVFKLAGGQGDMTRFMSLCDGLGIPQDERAPLIEAARKSFELEQTILAEADNDAAHKKHSHDLEAAITEARQKLHELQREYKMSGHPTTGQHADLELRKLKAATPFLWPPETETAGNGNGQEAA